MDLHVEYLKAQNRKFRFKRITLLYSFLLKEYWYSGQGSLTITDEKVDESTEEFEVVDDSETDYNEVNDNETMISENPTNNLDKNPSQPEEMTQTKWKNQ